MFFIFPNYRQDAEQQLFFERLINATSDTSIIYSDNFFLSNYCEESFLHFVVLLKDLCKNLQNIAACFGGSTTLYWSLVHEQILCEQTLNSHIV